MPAPRLLVTGASGFLGSHICELAHRRGYEVHGTVRAESSRHWIDYPWLHLYVLDLFDRAAVAQVLKEMDYVIHTAGVMSTTSRSPAQSRRINLHLTRILAEESAKAGIEKFVFCSSLAAGGPAKVPHKARTEDEPDRPVSCYGESKLDAEHMLFSMKERLHSVSLRFSTIYGPRDRNLLGFFKTASGGVIPLMGCGKAFTNSMIYVEDAARAALAALKADVASVSVYQITDGYPYPLPRLYDYLEEALEKEEKAKRVRIPYFMVMIQAWWLHKVVHKRGISPDQVRQMKGLYWFASNRKAKDELNWEPVVGIREGLKRTVEWYRANDWLSSPHAFTS